MCTFPPALLGADQLQRAAWGGFSSSIRSSSLLPPAADPQHPEAEFLKQEAPDMELSFFGDFSWKVTYIRSREEPGGSAKGRSIAVAAGVLENPPRPEPHARAPS